MDSDVVGEIKLPDEISETMQSELIRDHLKESEVHPRGCDSCQDSLAIATLLGLPEAQGEALAKDACLRELIQLWSTLDQSVQQAILTIARQSNRD